MALRYKRFYYDIDDDISGDTPIFVDEVLILRKVITFTDDGNITPSELFSDETRVFKVNLVMGFKTKPNDGIGKQAFDPFNWIAGRLNPEQIRKLGEFIETMNYLPLDYQLMSITDLKLSSLRKVVGDKGFVNETDVFPYATPIIARCYKSTDFQYKDANGELKRYFGKFFIINGSRYILQTAYVKCPKAPKPFDLCALAASNRQFDESIQNVNVCELSDIKFDDMLCIHKDNAFFYPNTIVLNTIKDYYRNYGFLISNIEKVDSAELDGHFSYRIKGRFVDDKGRSDFKSKISHGLDIGSALNLNVNKNESLVTLELGDIDDIKRVYADNFKFGRITHFSEGLFYVRAIEWWDGEKCEHPVVWPVNTVYRQFMQFDGIRRKTIDDYIGKLSDYELACIGPHDKLFCVE